MQQCQCNSPNSAEKQWVWTSSCPGFLPNGHFPPLLSFLTGAKFPQTALQHPTDTETAGNSPQSKERRNHNSSPTAACPAWIVQPEEQICPPHTERSRKEKGVPFAVSWRGQRAGSRDYCGQNKEQPRKDTIAIPPICQGPAWSHLLDLTPSHQHLHSPCSASCQASEQPAQRSGCDARGGSEEAETQHRAWGILSPWAGTLPAARQHTSLSTASETRASEGQDEQKQA